ncbi:bifunctional diguanylate cyclase/phosphodiesterase [Zoogloea sp.]|uniref:putative bifunctional diguanylate cyclase/phosphodiesterase n=1 Tax=Zoogloea sp. TaxID=49181 RepID=UPI001D8276DA|nr:GGDEF domain-containing phosphodiesterase [Zoogloea sp.]MBK6654188.1 EAL domain-containing protein [Zoogloea sp.]
MNTPAPHLVRSPCPVIDEDALARLLLRYGIGQGEQAAVRAFGRIISAAELADALVSRFDLGEARSGVEPSLRAFCVELARITEWDFTPPWPARIVELWSECYLGGAVAEFPFVAIEALLASCQQHLFSDRAMVHRLELDILTALVRLGWCLGGLLSDVSIDHEHAFRLDAEDGDAVLGIPNRRRFLSLLAERLSGLAEGQLLGLLVLDIEWGRSVDVLGMDERDHLRLALSDAMRAVLRPNDILCALGEDQWAVILPELLHSAQVSLAGSKLVDACEVLRSNNFPGQRGRFHAGGAWAREHANDPLGLIQAARSALIAAKTSGKAFDHYSADSAACGHGDAGFESEVARALEARQFQLFLQPQVELPSRRLVGAEALLRWNRDGKKSASPPDILQVLERIGLMGELSRWVIQQAAQVLATLADAGCEVPISVNLVADDLKDPELPLFIRQTCETWRVPVSRMCFELTEGGLVSRDGMSVSNLEALRVGGGRLALDDFGTGYSSMDYLRRLPVDELKLDKSFVERITLTENDRSIVELMVRIAHTFGLEVVAEGVEDVATETVLREMGCDRAQGYLYAPAMSVEQFIVWWVSRQDVLLSAPAP